MGFEAMVRRRVVKQTPMDRVTAALHVSAGTYKTPRMEIHIGSAVITRLGWQAGMRIGVLTGTGSDQGFIKLLEDPTGYKLGVKSCAGSCRLVFTTSSMAAYKFPGEAMPHGDVTFQAFKRELMLQLPDYVQFAGADAA